MYPAALALHREADGNPHAVPQLRTTSQRLYAPSSTNPLQALMNAREAAHGSLRDGAFGHARLTRWRWLAAVSARIGQLDRGGGGQMHRTQMGTALGDSGRRRCARRAFFARHGLRRERPRQLAPDDVHLGFLARARRPCSTSACETWGRRSQPRTTARTPCRSPMSPRRSTIG